MSETGDTVSGGIRKVLVGRLIDGSGQPAKENILMTIKEGRIAEMRPFYRGDGTCSEAFCQDLSAYTVMPPLFDCHVHLAIHSRFERGKVTARSTSDSGDVIGRHVRDCLVNGVLGVRDGGDASGNSLQYKINTLGQQKEVFRLYATGTAWHREGRYGKFIGRSISKAKDPVKVIEAGLGHGADHIKLVQSGLNSLVDFGNQTRPQFNGETIGRIFAASRKLGLGLMVHANGELPVAEAIAGGCDSIEHGYFMGDENLRKMADARIAWVPTVVPMKAYADHSPEDSVQYDVARKTLDHQLKQISRARDYGVPVALGTDSGSPGVAHGTSVKVELQLLVDAGYRLEEAISCATQNASRLLKSDLPGTLFIGGPASFIAVKGLGHSALEFGEVGMVVVEGERKVPEVA